MKHVLLNAICAYIHTQRFFFFTFFIQSAIELVCVSDTYFLIIIVGHFTLRLLSEASLVSGSSWLELESAVASNSIEKHINSRVLVNKWTKLSSD